MEKSAQDIQEILRRTGKTIGKGAKNISGTISDWYGDLSPEVRNAVIRGLAGAAIGGGLSGAVAHGMPKDVEDKSSVLSPALLGALLGGGAAASLPVGAKLLSSNIKFPGEKRRPLGSVLSNALLTPFIQNPATTIGGITGTGILARKGIGGAGNLPVAEAWKATKRFTLPMTMNAREKLVDLVEHIGRTYKGTTPGGKTSMLAAPVGLTLGWLIDKYLKGEY